MGRHQDDSVVVVDFGLEESLVGETADVEEPFMSINLIVSPKNWLDGLGS
jgi:hypothetical protein